MKKVTQIEVGGEIHEVVDSEGRSLLQDEVQRAKMAEDKIKADLQKVEEITEIGTKKLNSLLGDGEDSISGQIEKEISEVLQTSTDVFEKIEQISDWFEEDTTGSAALVDKVTNLENTKADKNGRYPDLSVGFSDNLVGRNETKESDFIFQPTANDWSVEDGVARIERIKGNTLVWNQLIDKDTYTANYSKITKEGDAIIVTTKTEEDGIVYDDGKYDPYIDYRFSYYWITDHKYYFSIQGSVLDDEKQSSFPVEGPSLIILTQIYGSKEGTIRKEWNYADHSNSGGNRWETIVTGNASASYKLFRVKCQAPGVRFKYKEPLCIDLTRMFGAGNEPTTVAEFRSMFPEINPEKVEGRLIDFKGGKLETDGFNQLCLGECVEFEYDKSYNPQDTHPFKEGTWWNGIGVNGYVRSKHKYTDVKIGNNSLSAISNGGHASAYGIGFPVRVIPGEKYYLNFNSPLGNDQTVKIGLFDIEGKYLNEKTQYNHTFTASPGAYWALLVFIPDGTDTTVNLPMEFTDINLNLYHSGYRNGEVELGGEKDDITIDLSHIKDKEGNLVFPDGCLRSAGNIYDEIIGNKVIRRIGVIEDLGVLDWKKYSTGNGDQYRFIAKATDILSNSILNLPTSKSNIAVSAGFNIVSAGKTYQPTATYSIFGEAERYLYLFSPKYQTYTENRLKEEVLSDVKMYYELANPEVYELPEPLPLDYRVWDFGTEHFTPELGGSGLKADIVYGFNAVDTIRGNKSAIESLKENLLGLDLDNKIEAEDTDIVVESIEENLVTNALRKTAQVLTDAEKQQVQKNIGVDGLKNDINTTVQTLKSDIDTEIIRAKNAEEILQSRYYNYLGNYPFSKKVLEVGADKMIIAGYLDIEYEEGKAYCFSVANPSNNALGLYKKEKDLPVGEANVTHVFNFVASKIDGSPYYLAKPTYGNSPKSWLILDWDSVVKYYDSLYDFDGIALSPSLFKGGGLSGRIEQVYSELSESISAEFNILNNHIISVKDELKDVYYSELDYNNSPVVNQFQKSNEVGAPLFSSSTFSGAAMYVGELAPFRYILSYFKSADWVESPKPITRMLLQIRQNDYAGEVLYSKLMSITIQPGEVKPVLFDLEEIKTLTGNLFVALRADTYATPMRPADDNYLFEPADGTTYPKGYYWLHGDIVETSKGSANYNAYNRNFYFQTFSEIEKISFLTEHVVKDIENRLNLNPNIEISLPDKIYAVVDDTLQLFYRGMIKAVNPYNYDILVSCSKGKQTPRYFHYKPKAEDVGVIDFTLSVRDNSAKTIASKTCKLHIVAAPKSPATKTNILCFGASNIAGGEWVKEVNRRLTKTEGTPAGNGLSNIEFCGSKKGDGAGWFGIGGWNWASYTLAGNPAFRFYVTDVESLSIGAVYTHNGFSYTIAEVNVTEGVGNILCKTSSKDNVPTVSGILTKSSGDGDNTITFGEYVVDAQNPLWDAVNNKMSFIPYANEVAGGQIDVVYTYLTWNGLSPNMEIEDFSTILSQAKKFADTLHAEFPNAKLKMMAQNPPSLNGGMGANYGATGGYSDSYGMLNTILRMNEVYQNFANSEGYSDFVEFVNVSSQFDVENNMPSAEYAVNTRNSKTERLDTNGVHPSLGGYYQIADVVYRNFVANFCQ